MSNKNLPYGVDISAYQGQIDFAKLLPKIDFLAARATISWGYQDKWFSRNRQLSEGKPFVAYHVLYPGENTNLQVDNLLRVAPPSEHIRYCIDSELAHGYSKGVITNAIRLMSERIKFETAYYPIQYSRTSWLNQYVSIADLPEMDWWLAQYLRNQDGVTYTPEHPGPPALPSGVSKWFMHQTGERGNGAEHGVPATANRFIDQNRFNGSKEDLSKYFGYKKQENIYLPIIVGPAPKPSPAPKVIWQRDPHWRDTKLGYSPSITIGQQGCLITSLTMVLNHYGNNETPATTNAKLQANGGFVSGQPNMYWKLPPKVWDIDYSVWREPWFGATDLKEIDTWLAKGAWVLVHVDLDLETFAIEQHWVVLTERVGNDYRVLDPWQGDEVMFSTRFGTPSQGIYRVCIYSKRGA